MSNLIEVVAIVKAKPEFVSAVKAAIETCVAATRQEKGCVSYTGNADVDDAGRFVFIERWEDQAALTFHEQQPHFLALIKAFDGRLVTAPEIIKLKQFV